VNGGTSRTTIDWVDFVRIDGITYLAAADRASRALAEGDVGPVYASVRHMLMGTVTDSGYHAQDGDAAYLPAGTPLYVVSGYAPRFRLVGRHATQIRLYEADTNPHAKTGADLLDITGKVHSIAILSDRDGVTQLGEITAADEVEALTASVLAAPVDQSRHPTDGQRYFLAFNLLDGTRVSRAYWPKTGELSRGILLPPPFAAAVARALKK
jgi:hypothetical protein